MLTAKGNAAECRLPIEKRLASKPLSSRFDTVAMVELRTKMARNGSSWIASLLSHALQSRHSGGKFCEASEKINGLVVGCSADGLQSNAG